MKRWTASALTILLVLLNFNMVLASSFRATGYYPFTCSKHERHIEGGKNDKPKKNYLDFDINSTSDITVEELDIFLAKSGLAGLGKCFKEVETTYNINAEALMAIAIEESGWGKRCANTNNLVGFEARKKSKNRYASFNSKEDCLHVVAKHLSNNYVQQGQKYFHKSSKIKDINHYYCELSSWKYNISALIMKIQKFKNNIRNRVDM